MGEAVGTNCVNDAPQSCSRQYNDDDIAVVGIAINVAGAGDVEEFWDLMLKAESQHIEVPAERFTFDSTNWRQVDPSKKWYGNFIQDYDRFDHKFFKKSPRDALYADPQQRLFLQCAYQAVEQSGYFNAKQPDKKVGVYVGVGSAEYEANFACHPTNAFSATGNLKSAIAGRVSHYFGWTGPGLAIDTACSAGAVALHLGCRSILSGECTAVLVGGTQMLTSPFHFQNLAGASFLSPTGACKPFDAAADGYCRGEGIGAVFLKKMSRARKDGDMVLGCIASTVVMQNENSTPMFVPNADSLATLFRDVVYNAGISPKDITMIEAHGTGTRVGDPAEYESIRRVFGGSSGRDRPLPVCSVKSLIGHTECASGIVSLIKILMMLHKEMIPLQIGFKKLNPTLHPSPDDMLEIPFQHRQWDQPFRAALVNSFGASGSNSAMVVTKVREGPGADFDISGKQPFWLTGIDAGSLHAYANKLANFIRNTEASVGDLSFHISRQSNRSLPKSLIFCAETRSELLEKLSDHAKGRAASKLNTMQSPRPVILCFGGQTSKSVGLSRQVFDSVPLLRKYLNQCEAILVAKGMGSLYPDIFQTDELEDTTRLQLALFALQYASAKVWMDCGVEVAAMVGHSFGELTCLAIGGVLSLEDTITAIHARAKLVKDDFGPDPGAMIAIEGDHERVLDLLGQSNKTVDQGTASIACYNGPTSFTVAGNTNAIDALEGLLPTFKELRSKRLAVSNAFHSVLVDPLMDKLRTVSEGMTLHPSSIRWERTTHDKPSIPITQDFFASHMREPVFVDRAFQRLHAEFPEAIWLEVGSNSTITRMAKKALNAPRGSFFQAVDITSNQGTMDKLAETVASLWEEGLRVSHWPHHQFERQQYRPLLLPPYQFEKTRHWLELKKPEAMIYSQLSSSAAVSSTSDSGNMYTFAGYIDKDSRRPFFRINSASTEYRQAVAGYKLADIGPICPAALAVDIATEALLSLRPDLEKSNILPEVQSLNVEASLGNDMSRSAWMALQQNGEDHLSWSWNISSTNNDGSDRTVHFTGEFEFRQQSDKQDQQDLAKYRRLIKYHNFEDLFNCNDADDVLQGRNLYKVFSDVVEYDPTFRGLQKVVGKNDRCAGRVVKDHTGRTYFDPYLSDCLLQVGTLWANCMTDRPDHETYAMRGIDAWMRSSEVMQVRMSSSLPSVWDVFATHSQTTAKEYTTDIFVFDSAKKLLVDVILGVRLSRESKLSGMSAPAKVTKDATLFEHTTRDAIPRPTEGVTKSNAAISEEDALAAAAALIEVPSAQFNAWRCQDDRSIEAKVLGGSSESTMKPAEAHKSASEAANSAQTESDLAASVTRVLAALSGADIADIKLETELADMGIDSLVEIELISDLQKHFQCDIAGTQEWSKIVTVTDLIGCVGQALQ